MENTTLIGTWFISGLNIVGVEDGILVMLPDGRAVQFPSSITRPRLNQTMRLWYCHQDGNSIRFRTTPNAKGWIRLIETSPEGWTMVCDDDRGRSEFPCRLAQGHELPDWYCGMIEENLLTMAATVI